MSVIRMKLKNKIKVTENQRVLALRNKNPEQGLIPENHTLLNVGRRSESIGFDVNQLFYMGKSSQPLCEQSEMFPEDIEHFQHRRTVGRNIRLDTKLEALEKVADKINNLNVYGGLEGLMNGVVKMT